MEEEVAERERGDGEMEDEVEEDGGREMGGLWRCEDDIVGRSNGTREFLGCGWSSDEPRWELSECPESGPSGPVGLWSSPR